MNPVEIIGTEPERIGSLTQDSHGVESGSVFIAVKGVQVDGHEFIKEAAQKGAAVIICEKKPTELDTACVLLVEDTRALVGPLAQAFAAKPADQLTVIGITGTNGKTTVATLAWQVLRALGVKASLLGTVEKRINDEIVESRLTTADPIELAADMRRMVDAGSTHLVMEVSSHALHQKRVEGIHFKVGAYTNLSHDHLDYHRNMDEYATAKKLLFDGLAQNARAVINADDNYGAFMASDCKASVNLFSFEQGLPEAVKCEVISNSAAGLSIKIAETQVDSPLIGRFNAYNVAQAFLICTSLGFKAEEIKQAFKSAKGAPGRLEKVEIAAKVNQPVVLVDYAHTPGALENVLQTLSAFKQPGQTLHVVFGCGGDRDKSKRPKMAQIAQQLADKVTITSDNPRNEDPDAIIDDAMAGFTKDGTVIRITDRHEAITNAIRNAGASTIILIAGKGHEAYQEVKGVRHHFDDREVAREALGQSNGNPKSNEVA